MLMHGGFVEVIRPSQRNPKLTNTITYVTPTSNQPRWINLVEQEYPEFIPHLSSCKSPQQVRSGVRLRWMHFHLQASLFSNAIRPEPEG
jgi:iron only hydrogenase large subunit-like protein